MDFCVTDFLHKVCVFLFMLSFIKCVHIFILKIHGTFFNSLFLSFTSIHNFVLEPFSHNAIQCCLYMDWLVARLLPKSCFVLYNCIVQPRLQKTTSNVTRMLTATFTYIISLRQCRIIHVCVLMHSRNINLRTSTVIVIVKLVNQNIVAALLSTGSITTSFLFHPCRVETIFFQ